MTFTSAIRSNPTTGTESKLGSSAELYEIPIDLQNTSVSLFSRTLKPFSEKHEVYELISNEREEERRDV